MEQLLTRGSSSVHQRRRQLQRCLMLEQRALAAQLVYLNGVTGSPSYWDALPAFWNNVLVDGKNVSKEATKLFKIMKKNLTAKP